MDKIRPPTPTERKALFWFQRFASSYTCWSRTCEAYEELLEQLQILADPSRGKHAFPPDEYKRAQWTIEEMRKALARLRAADRGCFGTVTTPNFREASNPVNNWFWSYNEGRYGPGHVGPFYMSYASYWAKLCKLLIDCIAVWNCGASILHYHKRWPAHVAQSPANAKFENPDAAFTARTHNVGGYQVPTMNYKLQWFLDNADKFPELPNPPPSTELRIIRSEDLIPATGLWEPFRASPEEIVRAIKSNGEDWQLWGLPNHPDLLNYMHEGHPAPVLRKWNSKESYYVSEQVSWLLLWEDDRYGDNDIPAEENLYPRFIHELGMLSYRIQLQEEIRKGGFI